MSHPSSRRSDRSGLACSHPGNARALDSSQVMTVRRKGTSVRTAKDAALGSDATQIRAVSHVGFGYANPAGVVRLYDAA